MALLNKPVIDKLKLSGIPATIDYLVGLPQCDARNVRSLNTILHRLLAKHLNLVRRAHRPKGKDALDSFLAHPFAFPSFDAKNQTAKRFVA